VQNAIGEEFNLASGQETRIIDLATKINAITSNPSPIQFLKKRKWDTKSRLLGSYEKANQLIGYEPKVSFDEGLKKTIEWFKNNWEFIQASTNFAPGMSSAVRGITQTENKK